MPTTPNKLMPALQFICALLILGLFCLLAAGPMFHLQPADEDMKATLKDIMLILTGFLFGSAVSSAKKDDANAALTAAILPAKPLGTSPAGTPDDPVNVTETQP